MDKRSGLYSIQNDSRLDFVQLFCSQFYFSFEGSLSDLADLLIQQYLLMLKVSLLLTLLFISALAHFNHHVHPGRQGVSIVPPQYVKHPLHGVEENMNSPVTVNAIIEIPEGTNAKYELDEETGLLMLDRILATPVVFPINYGFLPRTIGLDNDPLDIMVISSIQIPSLTLVPVRVLGVMRMNDTGQTDDKLIGVPEKDPVYTGYKELTDIPTATINKIKAFFETYKILDNKKVYVLGFQAKLAAYATIEDCEARYKYIYGH